MRSLAPRLALAFATLALMLGLFELGLRLAGFEAIHDVYSRPSIFWRADPVLGWSHTPRSRSVFVGPRPFPIEFRTEVEINSLGLRGPEIAELPDDGYRVLFLGDSMLAAFEVSSRDTFVARAERKLARALDVPIQLVNGGVRGYGTDQSYLYYRERGRDLAPDLVVFMHSANDVRNNMTLHRMRRLFGKPAFALEADGELELQGSPVPEYPLCSAYSMDQAFAVARRDGLLARAFCAIEVNAADHSALFTAASFAVQRSPALVRFIQRLTNASSAAAGASWRLAAPGVAHAQSVASPAIRVTLRLIEALAREAENSGAGFLLMISDAELQRLGSTRLDDAGVSWRPVRISVMKELGPDIHFRNDGHWNAYGHQLVGDLLAQVLLERIEEDLERRRSLSGGAPPAR